MKTISLTLLLLWLTLTGGMGGWQHPPLLVINLLLWGVLMLWLIQQTPHIKIDPVAIGLLLYVVAILISGAFTPHKKEAIGQAAIWFAYLGFYYLGRQWSAGQIQRAACWVLLLYAPLSFLPIDNPNVVSFMVLGLALLALPQFYLLLYGPLLLLLGVVLQSVGGVLAAVLGATRSASKRGFVYASIAPLLLLGWLVNPAGYAWRLDFWRWALGAFLSSPLVGVGPGGYQQLTGWQHAHNFILTTAAETGLIGLAAAGLLLYAIWRKYSRLPSWAAALVLAFCAWSLVDEPLRFFGAGFIFFMALSQERSFDD